VRKYVNQDSKSFGKESGKQQSILNPYEPYLQYRLSKFPELTTARLCREISALSCAGDDHNGLMSQFVTKVLKEPSPGTFKALGPTMNARIAQLKLSQVSKHRLTGDISAAHKRKNLYALSFVLSHSRVWYVQFTTRQDMFK